MEILKRSIGDNIRTLRRGKGMTQYELGKKCGMADSRIGVYERNESIPRKETLERIANALGVSIDDLSRN